jgi:hypothetical protein
MHPLLTEISEAIKKIELSISEDENSLNFVPLRKLSQVCLEFLIAEKGTDISGIAFFLHSYISNLFFNFGGDTIFDEKLLDSKKVIYASISKWLYELKESLDVNNHERANHAMNEMVKEYYKQVNFLNSQFK